MNDSFDIEMEAHRIADAEAAGCERGHAALDQLSMAPLSAAIRGGLTHDPRVSLIHGSSVQIEPVDWLWNGWLAAGKLHLIGGSPGTGKTTIATSLAATITRGSTWPDGSRAERGSVVFWSGEDDIADTLAPRLKAAGADMSKVYMIGGVHEDGELMGFDPARHMPALQGALMAIPDVRMIIVDPIISAVAGDSHKNAEVRRGLQPLVDLGMQLRAAVLGVTHLSKGTAGRDPAERITGSIGFVALARVVFVTVRQEAEGDEPGRRLLLRTKSNIGPMDGGFAYDLQQGELQGHPGVTASSVVWGDAIEGSTRELMARAESPANDDSRDAVGFLRDLLAYGPVAVKDVFKEADGAGYSRHQMQRAKDKLGIKPGKGGSGWIWSLGPSQERNDEEERNSLESASLRSSPHLIMQERKNAEKVEVCSLHSSAFLGDGQPLNSLLSHVTGEAGTTAGKGPSQSWSFKP